jgi:hypothetical protein
LSAWALEKKQGRKWLLMTALGGGFNRSMQHTNHRENGRSVADEATTKDLLFRYQSVVVRVGRHSAQSECKWYAKADVQ